MAAPIIPLGKYRHYKNQLYEVISIARHSETLEYFVIYCALYDNPDGQLWVRPYTMFIETVEVEGKTIPRFKKIED